jgi:hypothetical protein
MRACEGCRRRKIKCDSATTNTWPCAACVRLRLHCVPPSVNYEKEPTAPGTSMFELQSNRSYSQTPSLGLAEYRQPHFVEANTPLQSVYPDEPAFSSADYVEQSYTSDLLRYGRISETQGLVESKAPAIYEQSPNDMIQPVSNRNWTPEAGVTNLADAFGDLHIDTNGTSKYAGICYYYMLTL